MRTNLVTRRFLRPSIAIAVATLALLCSTAAECQIRWRVSIKLIHYNSPPYLPPGGDIDNDGNLDPDHCGGFGCSNVCESGTPGAPPECLSNWECSNVGSSCSGNCECEPVRSCVGGSTPGQTCQEDGDCGGGGSCNGAACSSLSCESEVQAKMDYLNEIMEGFGRGYEFDVVEILSIENPPKVGCAAGTSNPPPTCSADSLCGGNICEASEWARCNGDGECEVGGAPCTTDLDCSLVTEWTRLGLAAPEKRTALTAHAKANYGKCESGTPSPPASCSDDSDCPNSSACTGGACDCNVWRWNPSAINVYVTDDQAGGAGDQVCGANDKNTVVPVSQGRRGGWPRILHEIGHLLGLRHTHGNNATNYASGDRVCDTLFETTGGNLDSMASVNFSGENFVSLTCDQQEQIYDIYYNIMSYNADDDHIFDCRQNDLDLIGCGAKWAGVCSNSGVACSNREPCSGGTGDYCQYFCRHRLTDDQLDRVASRLNALADDGIVSGRTVFVEAGGPGLCGRCSGSSLPCSDDDDCDNPETCEPASCDSYCRSCSLTGAPCSSAGDCSQSVDTCVNDVCSISGRGCKSANGNADCVPTCIENCNGVFGTCSVSDVACGPGFPCPGADSCSNGTCATGGGTCVKDADCGEVCSPLSPPRAPCPCRQGPEAESSLADALQETLGYPTHDVIMFRGGSYGGPMVIDGQHVTLRSSRADTVIGN